MNGKIIAEKLLRIKNFILGIEKNPEIQEKLSVYGSVSERLKEGKRLCEKVTNLMTTQVEVYSDQYLATSDFSKFWRHAYGCYMVILKVIRVAFNEQPELLSRFNAIGKRNKSLSGWLRDATILYTNLLNNQEALDVMAQFGYTFEKITKEFQDVTKVEELHSQQLREKGIAQQSTLERDQAFDDLCKWHSKYRAIARIALYDKPQLLEALGIVKK
jgi:hemoglobin-like flavoprotein